MHALTWIGGFVLLILIVVGIHEGGHFTVAKLSGIRVDEFAIGFGPKLLSRRVGETLYSLRALPLGGYVKMPGMSALDEGDAGDRAFMRASVPRRLATILAGVTMNFLLAGVLFSVISIPGDDSRVTPGGPLAAAGLRSGDQVLTVGGHTIDHQTLDAVTLSLHDASARSDGGPIPVTYRRASDGTTVQTTVRPYLLLYNLSKGGGLPLQMAVDTVDGAPPAQGTPAHALGDGGQVTVRGHDLTDPGKSYSGTVNGVVSFTDQDTTHQLLAGWRLGLSGGGVDSRSLPQAFAIGFREVPTGIGLTLRTLGDAISSPSSGAVNGFQGPVGIVRDTGEATKAGWMTYLQLVGGISLGLGIINVLPIPPFDGGRVAIILAEVVTRKRIDARREMAFVVAGLMLVITFVVFITLHNDIRG